MSGSIDSSDRGKLFAYHGRAPYQSAESVGQRLQVDVFLHRDTSSWPQQHRDYLKSLGFGLPAAPGTYTTSGFSAVAPALLNSPGAEGDCGTTSGTESSFSVAPRSTTVFAV